MEKKRIVKKEIDAEVYNLFLKGLYHYKAEKFDECIPYMSRVIQLDSTYAPAYAYMGLSNAWITYRADRWQDKRAVNEAIFYSNRSIELDPDLAEGYSAIGLISWTLQSDFAKARIYFDKSIELNPGASLILNRYCYFLVWMGNFEKATQLALDAMKVDPVDFNSYVILYLVSVNSGRMDEAARYLQERKRIFAPSRNLVSYEIRLRFEQGAFEKVVHRCDSLITSGNSLDVNELSFLAWAYYKLNRVKESDTILKQLKSIVSAKGGDGSFSTALVYATRHEMDSCFAYLQLASQRRDQSFRTLKIEPALQELRKDPRYIKLYQDNGFDRIF